MEFQLIIRIPFECLDAIAARQKAKDLLKKIDIPENELIIKLQQLQENDEPKGVQL